jgi:hypothetical protein
MKELFYAYTPPYFSGQRPIFVLQITNRSTIYLLAIWKLFVAHLHGPPIKLTTEDSRNGGCILLCIKVLPYFVHFNTSGIISFTKCWYLFVSNSKNNKNLLLIKNTPKKYGNNISPNILESFLMTWKRKKRVE